MDTDLTFVHAILTIFSREIKVTTIGTPSEQNGARSCDQMTIATGFPTDNIKRYIYDWITWTRLPPSQYTKYVNKYLDYYKYTFVLRIQIMATEQKADTDRDFDSSELGTKE